MRGPAAAMLLAARSARAERRRRPSSSAPNVVVLMTDDQTLESMRVMTGVRSLLGRRGHHVRPRVRLHRALLSLAGDAVHRSVRAQPRRSRQPPARRRLRPARHARMAARLAPARRLHDRARRQVPQPLRPGLAAGRGAAGWSEWYASVDPSTYRYNGYLVNENGDGQGPRRVLDRPVRRAGGGGDRAAGAERGALLPLGRLPRAARRAAERAGRSARPADPGPGGASPRRLRGRAAAARAGLQRGRRVGQAELHPPRPTARAARAEQRSRRTTARSSSRCWPSTRRSRASSTPCAPAGSWTHPDRLHLGQRLLPRRAPRRLRQGAWSTSRRSGCR